MSMDKPYQINDSEGIYFLTFATVAWVDVFTRLRYREIVVNSLEYCQKEKGLIIYAWCLMSNHLHLIAGVKQKEPNLSDVLRDLKKFTAKQILQSIQNQEEPESRREWMLCCLGVRVNVIQEIAIFSFGNKKITLNICIVRHLSNKNWIMCIKIQSKSKS